MTCLVWVWLWFWLWLWLGQASWLDSAAISDVRVVRGRGFYSDYSGYLGDCMY